MENKFDDAIYNYLYTYWKEQSGEYDPKKDVIPESEMNKMHPKTKNEKKFEQWLLQQYGMTKKEQRGYTLEGNLESLWEIFSAADMVLFARGLPSIGKELAQLGKKAVDDVVEEAIEKTVKTEVVGETVEKTVKTEVTEEVVEGTAKKEIADTVEDLSQKTADKEDSNVIKKKNVADNKGNYKPSNKPYKNNKEANKQAQKQGYKDAHELKEDYVGKSNVSKYDMKYDTKTGEIYLESKDGKTQIPTGLIHEP